MKCCPHCGREYPPRFRINGPVRSRMVEIIANHPNGIGRGDIMSLLYADEPGGGPTNLGIVSVLKQCANKDLADQGYRIVSTLGRGALFRLVKIDADTKRKPARPAYDREVARLESAGAARVHR